MDIQLTDRELLDACADMRHKLHDDLITAHAVIKRFQGEIFSLKAELEAHKAKAQGE